MKNYRFKLSIKPLLFLVLFLMLACDKKLVDKYENGNIKIECELKDNLRHGICKKYYQFGGLKEYSEWENGVLNGIRKRYDSLGNLVEKSSLEKGVLEGLNEIYENGNLKEKYFNKNGLPHGKYYLYHNNGNVSVEGYAKNGDRVGKIKNYRKDGSLSSIHEYIIREGKSYVNQYWIYDKNGKLKKESSSFVDLFLHGSDTILIELTAPFYNEQAYFISLEEFKEITKKERRRAKKLDDGRIHLNASYIKSDTLRGVVEETKTVTYQDSTVIKRRQIYIQYPSPEYFRR